MCCCKIFSVVALILVNYSLDPVYRETFNSNWLKKRKRNLLPYMTVIILRQVYMLQAESKNERAISSAFVFLSPY